MNLCRKLEVKYIFKVRILKEIRTKLVDPLGVVPSKNCFKSEPNAAVTVPETTVETNP